MDGYIFKLTLLARVNLPPHIVTTLRVSLVNDVNWEG